MEIGLSSSEQLDYIMSLVKQAFESQIADEVIAHLSSLLGADVKLTLEIEASIPDGTPEQVIRIVTENSRTLKFDDSGFENE